jgi:hypothetical protein
MVLLNKFHVLYNDCLLYQPVSMHRNGLLKNSIPASIHSTKAYYMQYLHLLTYRIRSFHRIFYLRCFLKYFCICYASLMAYVDCSKNETLLIQVA